MFEIGPLEKYAFSKRHEFSTIAPVHFIFDSPEMKLHMPKRQFMGRTSLGHLVSHREDTVAETRIETLI